MSLQLSAPAHGPHDPLDILEEIVTANEWRFERSLDGDMVVEIPGRWCEYRLFFLWRGDLGALYFSCAFDIRVPEAKAMSIALVPSAGSVTPAAGMASVISSIMPATVSRGASARLPGGRLSRPLSAATSVAVS